MSFATLFLAFLPVAVSPEAEGVSSRKLLAFLDACEQKIDCLHGFVFLRHGKVIAEGSWKPFDTLNEPHRLSSHSKCFVSTAIGFLVDDNKLDIDERVIDILPDKKPAKVSEYLAMLRIRDLLTMTNGASDLGSWERDLEGDWVRNFLETPITTQPGLKYAYDSNATQVLGAIVERRSGMKLMDFLQKRLFAKVGIEKCFTTYDPTGLAIGAWGFNMTTREISLVGQLYLNKGLWNGERLLSEDWVVTATSRQTHSGKTPQEFDPRNDWLYGFGYNIWRCQHNCYRADGSGGQYTIVFPDQDAVLSLHSDVYDMQKDLDVVWSEFLPVFSEKPLPEDKTAADALKARCANLAFKPVEGAREGGAEYCGKDIVPKKTTARVRKIRLDRTADGWNLTLGTDAGSYVVPVGYGIWKKATMRFSPKTYENLGDLVGDQRVAASAAVQKDGSLKLRMHVLGGTHRLDLVFKHKLFGLAVEGGSMGLGKIEASFK